MFNNDKNYKSRLIKRFAIFQCMLLAVIFLLSGCNIATHNTFKLEKVAQVNLELKSFENFYQLRSAKITLVNNSHNFRIYVLMNHSNSSDIFFTNYDCSQTPSGDILIDYNIGNVTINMTFHLKNMAGVSYYLHGSFNCHTKGADNKIKFYNDFNCKDPTDFKIEYGNGFYRAVLDIKTTYM